MKTETKIRRRGVPMATPLLRDAAKKTDLRSVANAIQTLRKDAILGKTTIRELIDEGRLY